MFSTWCLHKEETKEEGWRRILGFKEHTRPFPILSSSIPVICTFHVPIAFCTSFGNPILSHNISHRATVPGRQSPHGCMVAARNGPQIFIDDEILRLASGK